MSILALSKKHPLLFAVIFASVASCTSYGDVYVAQDKFKQARIVTLAGNHRSEETHGIANFPKAFNVNYAKAQKPGVPVPVEMKLVFMQVSEKTQLSAKAAVLIDAESHDIQIVNLNQTVHVSANPNAHNPGELREIISYKIFGTIIFPPELWQKMAVAKSLAYRLFIDDLPYTFMLSPEMLEKLRLFSRQ